jgi:hypothetical protein
MFNRRESPKNNRSKKFLNQPWLLLKLAKIISAKAFPFYSLNYFRGLLKLKEIILAMKL